MVISRNSNGTSSTTYVVPDHLGSSDTLLNESGATVAKESFGAFGTRRGSNWSAATAPDWLGIANTSRQGFTGHEMLDNVGLVHMNGRVYDPALGPLPLGRSADRQPGRFTVREPLCVRWQPPVECDGSHRLHRRRRHLDLRRRFHRRLDLLHARSTEFCNHGGLPPPPATALPGRSAQNGVGMCGAGLFAPPCTGKPLYAAAPPMGRSGLPTSSWAETAVDDAYAQENLERFLLDLGINAVDILILSPVHDAKDAYDAAQRGETATAILYVGFTICDVAKPCQSILAPTKALRRAAKSFDASSRNDRGCSASHVPRRTRRDAKDRLATGWTRRYSLCQRRSQLHGRTRTAALGFAEATGNRATIEVRKGLNAIDRRSRQVQTDYASGGGTESRCRRGASTNLEGRRIMNRDRLYFGPWDVVATLEATLGGEHRSLSMRRSISVGQTGPRERRMITSAESRLVTSPRSRRQLCACEIYCNQMIAR